MNNEQNEEKKKGIDFYNKKDTVEVSANSAT